MPMANIGGPVPPPQQWWAFYVPALLLALAGAGFEYCGREYGATDTTRACEVALFGFAAAWLVGAIKSTARHLRRKR